jgi:predicted DNA-binding transcriptional regulator YafY
MKQKLSKVERQQIILERLKDTQEEQAPTLEDLIEHIDHERDAKTIRRDIDELNDMGADIHCEREDGQHRYFLHNDFRLPNTFSAEDMVHFMILKNALAQNEAGFLDAQIGVLAQKIAAVNIEQADVTNLDINEAVSFKPPPVRRVDSETWKLFFDAVINRRTVDVVYCPGNGIERDHVFLPYHLACLEGEWYLLAGTKEDARPRQYVLASVQSATMVAGKNMFHHPDGFNPKELLATTFGRFVGGDGPTTTVRVEISGFMTRFVRDRPFHSKQIVEESDDGETLTISFPVRVSGPHPFGNVVSWVLSRGPHARVLEPPSLIEKVREEAEGVVALYND